MKVLKYPVIIITLSIAAGIFTGFACLWPLHIIVSIFVCTLAATSAAYFYSQKQLIPKPYFETSSLLLAFSIGLLAQWLSYTPNNPDHYSRFLKNDTPTVRGVITERLKPNDYNEKYLFSVAAIDQQPASGTLLISLPKDSLNTHLHTGDVLFINSELKPILPAMNPYQFDYAKYMAKQNVFHQVKLKDNYIITGTETGFNYSIQQLRDRLTTSFSIHHYPATVQNLINALLFGQRQDMDKETNDNYINAGVIHILAISGLHFTLLFAILNWLLAPLKRIPKLGNTGHFIAILTLMWLFGFITGLSASVVRSVVMFSFLMAGQAMARRVSIYNSLAVSALVLLIAKPSFLFDAGFQLSYLAVQGIVWFQPLYKGKLKSKYRVVNMTRDLVMVSLTAQIAVLPISLYYFGQLPLLFLLANIVVIPLSNLVLILGLITLALNFVFPALALWVGKLLEWAIYIMNYFTAWVASLDVFVIKNIPFTLTLCICLYGVIITIALSLQQKSYTRIVAALVSILVLQLAYMGTVYNMRNTNELLVLHNYDHSIIVHKNGDHLSIVSTDSLALQNRNVLAYAKGNFNPETSLKPIGNYVYFNGKKIFVMDSTGVYDSLMKPDVLIITQSPRVNLDRVLNQMQPKAVIADATNYKTYVNRWAATCHKRKIPFHATAEKGSYILK
ncbi:ComEC/Rec2 family competence protein [Flavobacterium sp. RHBU_3]|uniref:ComEC/Rec2 family competence protein n=1 Tax=Flavobacterium sp. RHBU_3 TaxID=3391184 RepID=UPI00398547BE